MYGFENTVVLITGASSGIGRATAKRFTKEGAHVVIADIDTEGGQRVVDEITNQGGSADFREVDIGEPSEISSLIDEILEEYGRIDYAINNAAIGNEPKPISDINRDEWEQIIGVNQTGVWAGLKYEIPALKQSGGGSIVNVSSKAGIRGSPQRSPYAASKHGVIGLTRTSALEVASDNIRINAVCPTIIDTPALQSMPEQEKEALTENVPMKRLGSPEEVANVIAWLCSEEASFITGQAIPVDGGETQK